MDIEFILQISREVGFGGGSECVAFELHAPGWGRIRKQGLGGFLGNQRTGQETACFLHDILGARPTINVQALVFMLLLRVRSRATTKRVFKLKDKFK